MAEPREYYTVANQAESEANIKGSQFISHCARVESSEAAQAFIQSIRAKHPDATHNCWAYRINANEYRFNDDGEPGGTAGQPIWQAISAANLEQVCVVVTRYYGGTKLGAGGLVRAYGGGAAAVLKAANTILIKPTIILIISVPFSEQNSLYHFLSNHAEITVEQSEYTNDGLQLAIKCYLSDRAMIESALTNALRGRIEIIEQ